MASTAATLAASAGPGTPRATSAAPGGNHRNSQALSAISGSAARPASAQAGPSSSATTGTTTTAMAPSSGNITTAASARQRSTAWRSAARSCWRADIAGSISRHSAVKTSSRTVSTRRNAMCTSPSGAAPAVAPISTTNSR